MFTQRQLQLDIPGFYWGQPKKFFGCTHLPSFFLQHLLFRLIHHDHPFELIVIVLETSLASLNYLMWRASRFLFEHIQNYNGIRINSVNDSPVDPFVDNSKFMAARPYG